HIQLVPIPGIDDPLAQPRHRSLDQRREGGTRMKHLTGDSERTATGGRKALDLDFDPDELRAKYAHERDRRLRSDGTDQYIAMAENFERLTDDPFAPPGFTREPVDESVDTLIIGAGLAGMQVAARLRMAGRDDFRILDPAGDFGGTWYWNR